VFQYIYHIASKEDWEKALASEQYRPPDFEKHGFVHCSTRDQLLKVANGSYRGRRGLILLVIEPRRLTSPVCYENLTGRSPLFPHVYGPINLDALDAAVAFEPGDDGHFQFPAIPLSKTVA
jgi:uncharacterized protein (DUF952 family)